MAQAFIPSLERPHPLLRKTETAYEFTFKYNHTAAPELTHTATVTVAKKTSRKDTYKVRLNNEVKAIILHHLVNEGKWHRATGPSREAIANMNNRFWAKMPPVRAEEHDDDDGFFNPDVMAAVFTAINSEVTAVSKQMREAGFWSMGGELSTYPNTLRAAMGFQDATFAPLRTAPMAVHQVNLPTYTGTIKTDAKICGVADGELARVVRASLRENPTSKEKMMESLQAIQTVFMDAMSEGGVPAFTLDDLAQRRSE